MPLNIEQPEADELEQFTQRNRPRSARGLEDELRSISNRCAALPDFDARSPEEIIGFDEHGLPT